MSPDANANRTNVKLETISAPQQTVSAAKPGVFVMRTVASPFGHNAPLKPNYNSDGVFLNTFSEWALTAKSMRQITLSARYEKVLTGSWLVIEQDNAAGTARLWIFSKVKA